MNKNDLRRKIKRIERVLACENFDEVGIMCNNLYCRYCRNEKPYNDNND